MAVFSMLYHRDLVHHRCSLAIDVFPCLEGVQDPLLSGKPGKHPCLDRAEVADHEAAAWRSDECGPYQLGEDRRGVAIAHLYRIEVTICNELPAELDVVDMVLREVVCLHDPAGPAPGPVGAIELQDPAQPAILAYRFGHCLVLLR